MMVAATGGETALRRRGRAVLLLCARLALRAVDVARLELDDVDWRAGTICVRGKGGQIDLLPLPMDVGQALAEHLRTARPPSTTSRALFLRSRAPFTALSSRGVQGIILHAGLRAGLGSISTHRLRHTAATVTINAGASLEERGQLLRHRSLASTTIYAKVDLVRLRSIARPWPESPRHSLEEVGQLLRHRSLASTTIYTKADLVRLQSVARPWPEPSRHSPEAVSS